MDDRSPKTWGLESGWNTRFMINFIELDWYVADSSAGSDWMLQLIWLEQTTAKKKHEKHVGDLPFHPAMLFFITKTRLTFLTILDIYIYIYTSGIPRMETFKICQYHWVGPRTRRAPLPCPEALAEFMVDEKAGAPKTNSKALSLKIGKIPKTGCWFQPISKWEIFPK